MNAHVPQGLSSNDAALGMIWWNHITDRERREWMRRAGDTGIAADAWECFKRETARG